MVLNHLHLIIAICKEQCDVVIKTGKTKTKHTKNRLTR